MWANITYFLKAVVPEAEKAGVRLALHPNDPPAPVSRGSEQIMATIDGWKKLISIVNSPSNGITFDCGVTREMGGDPVEVCRYFGSRDRINHVHFRNVMVKKPYERYTEVFIDEGENDMFAVMKELVKQKYTRLIYPEHPRGIDYDRERPNFRPQYPGGGGYAGYAFNVGYTRAMMQAALSGSLTTATAEAHSTASRTEDSSIMKRSLLPAIGIALVALVLSPALSHAQLFSLTKEQMVEFTAQNPFERFADGRPKVPDGLIERVRGLSAEEVLAVLPGKRFRNQYADGFRVLHPGKRLAGRAFTVQFMPVRPDLDTVVQARAKTAGLGRMYNQAAIDMLQPGDVLVVDLFGQEEGGTIVGDNLFYYIMKATKGAGLVVDGAIRDLEGIQNMDMPAYFRAAHPSAISNVMITGINVPVRIGKATVMPGDVVFGDAEGVYFIPPALVRTGRGQRRRDPHPRRMDAHEVRRRKIQVQRNLRHAEGSGAAEGIPGLPQETARGDSQEESQVAAGGTLI